VSGADRRIGRAAILNEARLFSETAEEYNAALAGAPGRSGLIVAAIDANRRINKLAIARLSANPSRVAVDRSCVCILRRRCYGAVS
jgi:hypothetical protein